LKEKTMRNCLRFVGAVIALGLLATLPGCISTDPAAFLTQAAEAKGRLSEETLGRVAKAVDFYCLSVPSVARAGLREELASHTTGARLVITCPGDLSMLTPPAQDPPVAALQRIEAERAALSVFDMNANPPDLLSHDSLRVPLVSVGTAADPRASAEDLFQALLLPG
jgi:hypothetical protein